MPVIQPHFFEGNAEAYSVENTVEVPEITEEAVERTVEVPEESFEEADEIAEMEQEKEDRQTRKITAIGGIIFVAFLLLIAISKLIPSGSKYEFILEGNTVQIPCSYYDFEDLDAFMQTDSGKYLFMHIQGLMKSYTVMPKKPWYMRRNTVRTALVCMTMKEKRSMQNCG